MYNPVYQLYSPDFKSVTALSKLIKTALPARQTHKSEVTRKFLDTYDWRLFNAGFLMEADITSESRVLRLRQIQADASIIEQPEPKLPHFFWDVPPGKMQDKLKKLLQNKSLMEVASVRVKTHHFEQTDKTGKKISDLRANGIYASVGKTDKRICCWLEIQPVRNYSKQAITARNSIIKKHHFFNCDKEFFFSLFNKLDKIPLKHPTRLEQEFDRDMPSHKVLSSLMSHYLDLMDGNEIGILQDIDNEYLHSFRVGNRRSRSLLTQVKQVFPETEIHCFCNDFAWLSMMTSKLRDLDVFITDLKVYQNNLAPEDTSLEPLIGLLQQERSRHHTRLLQSIESMRYHKFKRNWRRYLNDHYQEPGVSTKGKQPIINVASRAIWRNYRKLLKLGETSSVTYKYESIHELRKTGKKLRYLLEGFVSLYPETAIKDVIASLKKLQNNLGTIVDMHIQRGLLEHYKQKLPVKDQANDVTIKAIDQFINESSKAESDAANNFKKRFKQFSSKKNKKLFKKLFN